MEYGITLNKITDDILNDVYGGIPEDEYSKEQVMFKVFRWRELLASRDIERNDIDPLLVQSIVVPFSLTAETIPCGTSPCKVLRSNSKIPKLIRTKSNFVWTLESLMDDMTESPEASIYTPIFPQDRRWITSRRTTGSMKFAYIENDYLFIINDDMVRYGKLNGIFYDPREAAVFSNCDGNACYTDDDPFPITGYMLNIVYQEVLKEIKGAIYGMQAETPKEEADRVAT